LLLGGEWALGLAQGALVWAALNARTPDAGALRLGNLGLEESLALSGNLLLGAEEFAASLSHGRRVDDVTLGGRPSRGVEFLLDPPGLFAEGAADHLGRGGSAVDNESVGVPSHGATDGVRDRDVAPVGDLLVGDLFEADVLPE